MDKEQLKNYLIDVIKIPRASKDEKAISDYIMAFAEARGGKVEQDSMYNLKIWMPATGGSSQVPVALQGHLDMVYVKDHGSSHIYEDGIDCTVDGDRMYSADNTSLGADNGIALAYCLALMDSADIIHPPLEIILTVQEEIGLNGAAHLDCADLQARNIINLDSENEGEFFVSCAGGVRNYLTIPVQKNRIEGLVNLTVVVSDLRGGHSGTDIDLGRGNAIKILGRILDAIDAQNIPLASFKADGKANAIPTRAAAVIGVPADCLDSCKFKLNAVCEIIKEELKYTDTFVLTVEAEDNNADLYYSNETKQCILAAIKLMPNGVISKSFAVEGLVETSANIGAVEEIDETLRILSSIRSSLASRKIEQLHKIDAIARLLGGGSEALNDYPQWNYHPNSQIRTLSMAAYQELFNKEGKMASIHGGLECGYFDNKMKNVDMVSFGCNLYDVHTAREQISLSSFYNVWLLLTDILKRLAC